MTNAPHLFGLMIVYVLMIPSLTMAPLILVVRGVQGIKYFGWNSRYGLWGWYAILVGLNGAYVASEVVLGRPPQMPTIPRMISVAIGLIVGGVLLVVVKPRWTTSVSKGFLTFLIFALVIMGIVFWNTFIVYHMPFSGWDLSRWVLLIVFPIILLLIEHIHPKDSESKAFKPPKFG